MRDELCCALKSDKKATFIVINGSQVNAKWVNFLSLNFKRQEQHIRDLKWDHSGLGMTRNIVKFHRKDTRMISHFLHPKDVMIL